MGIQESSESSIFALSQSNDGNVMGFMGLQRAYSSSLSSQYFFLTSSHLFTVFIVLSIVCTGIGWKCLDFDRVLEIRTTILMNFCFLWNDYADSYSTYNDFVCLIDAVLGFWIVLIFEQIRDAG
jgi:hypothetical protein